MPLPKVHPKRKKWYVVDASQKKSGRLSWKNRINPVKVEINLPKKYSIEKNVDDFFRVRRWKFFKEDEDFGFVDGFMSDYKRSLAKIQQTMVYESTLKLTEIMEKRAYVEYVEKETNLNTWYLRTYFFPSAFDVFIYIRDNRLVYEIHYFYEYLRPKNIFMGYDGAAYLPRYKSLYGADIRDDLPDILNTPITLYTNRYDARFKKKSRKVSAKAGRRKGRFFEVFDNWFRTEGYQRFLELCDEEGLIIR